MSLATFKKKSVIISGTNRSGKSPGGYWLPQGPFGHNKITLSQATQSFGSVGFSLNGTHRNKGGVGKDMKMSKSGTPYRGTHPIGWGGTNGRYPSGTLIGNGNDHSTGTVKNYASKQAVVQPLLVKQPVVVLGDQYLYVKQSVLSNNGMLRKRYRWAYNGQYPNYWVQPIYDSANLSDNASQGLYIHNKKATYTRYINVNNKDTYIGYIKRGGPTGCDTSTTRYTYNLMAQNGPYTKELAQPRQSSEYTTYIQRGCVNPTGIQKPFPYATQTGKSTSVAGGSVRSFSTGCNTGQIFTSPPAWYTGINTGSNTGSNTESNNKKQGSESGC
jgi:hypothetical protein